MIIKSEKEKNSCDHFGKKKTSKNPKKYTTGQIQRSDSRKVHFSLFFFLFRNYIILMQLRTVSFAMNELK